MHNEILVDRDKLPLTDEQVQAMLAPLIERLKQLPYTGSSYHSRLLVEFSFHVDAHTDPDWSFGFRTLKFITEEEQRLKLGIPSRGHFERLD